MALGWEGLSGKFAVLAAMLALLRKHTDDRIVIVSNYTQTLDLIATLCRERQVGCHHAQDAPCLQPCNTLHGNRLPLMHLHSCDGVFPCRALPLQPA